MDKLFNKLIVLFLIFMALKIFWTQKFTFSRGGQEGVFLGNWSYLLGSLFLSFGIYFFYLIKKDGN